MTTPAPARRSPLVASGLTELALSALSGWLFTLCKTRPDLARKLGVHAPARIRQWHLDLAALGTASVAVGLAMPDAPRRVTGALTVGAWTNAMAFLPMAYRPQIEKDPRFLALVTLSFLTTTYGFCGMAVAALRRRKAVAA